jgi:N-acetylneuraminic acid mutarotase
MIPSAKNIFFLLIILTGFGSGLLFSCKREISCEDCMGTDKIPISIAGPDQVVSLPTDSISIDGTASYDPDGKIVEWFWKKISGPASFNIVTPRTAKTSVRNLVAGTYQFELKVIDDGGLSAKDTINVSVHSTTSNHPPTAKAGKDQTITLPTSSVNLDGAGSSDPDNNIANYQWSKISGPPAFNIVHANAVQTPVNNLQQGVYEFELTVSDSDGLSSNDTVQITVNDQAPTIACDYSNRATVSAQLSPVGALSKARAGMAVSFAGNKIFFAGGRQDNPLGVSSRIDIFDLADNTWSTEELSVARYWTAAVAAGNKVFFAGGQTDDGMSVDNVDIYDVSSNTWWLSRLSRQADGLGAATVGNKVFFAGGNWGIYAVSTVDIYDLATDTWSTASLSIPRNFITAVSANNKVYFTGGDPWTGQMSNVIDIYDNSSNAWSTSTLQFPRSFHATTAVNGILYFGGGLTSRNSLTCSVETLDANTGARALMNLSGPGSWAIDGGQNAVIKDNKLIFLNAGGDPKRFDIFDIGTNTWSIGVLSQPIPAESSVISVNNTIYVAGGFVNGGLSNQVWKLEF